MTTKQTLRELAAAGKKVSLGRLYIYLKACGIKPSGANQRPQQYPADTAEVIKAHLGLPAAPGQLPLPLVRSAGILTLKQLKTHQPKRKK